MFIGIFYDQLEKYIDNPIKSRKLLDLKVDPHKMLQETKDVCDSYLASHSCAVRINRQPTLTRSSTLSTYVSALQEENTVDISPALYAMMNADIDGDMITSTKLKEEIKFVVSAIFSAQGNTLDTRGNDGGSLSISREFALNALTLIND